MRLVIWIGDEGPTDLDMKDGDIFAVHPNSWEPGTLETQRWLVIEMEEYGGDQNELTQPEFTTGPSPQEPVQRHARKYKINYWEKFTPQELADIRDRDTHFPISTGKFSLVDILRK